MAGGAAREGAPRGDFIDRIVQSVTHSLVSQLKAEHLSELAKAVELAHADQKGGRGRPLAQGKPGGADDGAAPPDESALAALDGAATAGMAELRVACTVEEARAEAARVAPGEGQPLASLHRPPAKLDADEIVAHCQSDADGAAAAGTADLRVPCTSEEPVDSPNAGLKKKRPPGERARAPEDAGHADSIIFFDASPCREPAAVAAATSLAERREGRRPQPTLSTRQVSSGAVLFTTPPALTSLNVPEHEEHEEHSRSSSRERCGSRRGSDKRKKLFASGKSFTSPGFRSEFRTPSGASRNGSKEHSTLQKQGSFVSALPLTTDEEKLLATLREEQMHKEQLAEKRFGATDSLLLRSYAFLDDVPTAQKVTRHIIFHPAFDYVIAAIIVINAVALGVEASVSVQTGEVPVSLQVLEWVFILVYTVEVGLRFHAVGTRIALTSNWVKFDSILVLLSLFNNALRVSSLLDHTTGNVVNDVNLLKMVRILRLARTVRLLVRVRTLWLLIQGLIHAMVPMFWTTIIMVVVVYMFAVIGMELIVRPIGGEEYQLASTKFHTLADSMLTLMQFMTLDNMEAIYRPLIMGNPALSFYFLTFFLLGPVALMGIVTAILVESSIRTAKEDQEAKKVWTAMKKKTMLPKLRCFFEALDADEDGEISLDEILEAPAELREQLTRIVDLDEAAELFHLLDVDGGGTVNADEFVNGIIRSQEDKPVELLVLVKQCRTILNRMEERNQLE